MEQASAHIITTSLPVESAISTCVIADSPHSGRHYPQDFNHVVSREALRRAEDAYLDRVYSFLPEIGVPFVQAEFPRSYIDANQTEGSSKLVRLEITPRYRENIYATPPDSQEIFNRISGYYRPYHQTIHRLRNRTLKHHGRVVHLNLHSMPSLMLEGDKPFPFDIIIGTIRGRTAHPLIAQHLCGLFRERGYRVSMNLPYFIGGEIVRRSGRPAKGMHAIQIEINRALYLDEDNVNLKPVAAARLQNDLKEIVMLFRDFCDRADYLKKSPKLAL